MDIEMMIEGRRNTLCSFMLELIEDNTPYIFLDRVWEAMTADQRYIMNDLGYYHDE